MDPMPGTNTTTIGARGHVLGDLEGSVDFPNTLVVDTKDGQILGLDAVYIGGVGNGESTSLQVIMALDEDE